MAKYSMKKGGKEVGPASVYAEPHTMKGKKVSGASAIKSKTGTEVMNEMDISTGNMNKKFAQPKTSGIKIRGTGAATKGTMARGPMA